MAIDLETSTRYEGLRDFQILRQCPTAVRTVFDSFTFFHFFGHATIHPLLITRNAKQCRPRWIVRSFGFFFLRDGNGDCDNDHDDDDDDNDDDDVDVDGIEPNAEKDRRKREEGKGDSAEAVILKHRPIEHLRLSTDFQ